MYLAQIQALGIRIDILSIKSIAIMEVSLECYNKWVIISEKAEQKVNGLLVAICLFTSDRPYSPKVFSVGL